MARVFYNNRITTISYGTKGKHIKTDQLIMSEAMQLALDIGCDFDWEDVSEIEIADCIYTLKDIGFEIDTSKDADGYTDHDFFRLFRNIEKMVRFQKVCKHCV